MHHLAIMNPRWQLISKILSGQKTIESRWYRNRIAPWGKINAGDTIFFKDAGKLVTVKATVTEVRQQEIRTINEGIAISRQFIRQLCFSENALTDTYWLQGKRYVILAFLGNPAPIEPFAVDKRGYGSACAWITVPDIKSLRKLQQ
jgi:ASC-1-like (ASCH) protein